MSRFNRRDGHARARPQTEADENPERSQRLVWGIPVSPLMVAGIVMLFAGLSCLGWVAYQHFGTSIVSTRVAERERAGIRAEWHQQVGIRAQGHQHAAVAPKKKTTKTKPKKESVVTITDRPFALLRMPAFGPGFEVPILPGTSSSMLSRGVGHYEGTAMPGQIGNFAVAGHRVTHGEPFRQLLELDKDAKVIIETRDAVYTYVIDEPPRRNTVRDTRTCVIEPVPCGYSDPSRRLLTLTTCKDLFHSSYRSVGFAHLESTKQKANHRLRG